MVLGIMCAFAACPAIIGTTEAVRQGQRKDAKERHRGVKSNLIVSCFSRSRKRKDVHGGSVVLRDNKLYIQSAEATSPSGIDAADTDSGAEAETEAKGEAKGEEDPDPSMVKKDKDKDKDKDHPFTGYFLPFPGTDWGRKGEGLVSTISDDPPQLNWIYVDEDTFEVKYGLRVDAEPHYVGPWDCTLIDKRLTFNEWEGFVAVEESDGVWAVYFDLDDDGLIDYKNGRKVLEIELTRRERRKRKGDD